MFAQRLSNLFPRCNFCSVASSFFGILPGMNYVFDVIVALQVARSSSYLFFGLCRLKSFGLCYINLVYSLKH